MGEGHSWTVVHMRILPLLLLFVLPQIALANPRLGAPIVYCGGQACEALHPSKMCESWKEKAFPKPQEPNPPEFNGETCPLHGEKLRKGNARIVYGIVGAIPDDPDDHPKANLYTTGGCVESYHSSEYEQVFYCPVCRKKREAKEKVVQQQREENPQISDSRLFDIAATRKNVLRMIELARSNELPQEKKDYLDELANDPKKIEAWMPEDADENRKRTIRSQFASYTMSPEELLKLNKDDPSWSDQIYTRLANGADTPEEVLRSIAKIALEPPPPGIPFNKNMFLQISLLGNMNTPKEIIESIVDSWLDDTTPFADQFRANGALLVMLNKKVSSELFERFFKKKFHLIDPAHIAIRFEEISSLVVRHSALLNEKKKFVSEHLAEKDSTTGLICAVARDGLTKESLLAQLEKAFGDISCPRSETLVKLVAENRKNREKGYLCDPIPSF